MEHAEDGSGAVHAAEQEHLPRAEHRAHRSTDTARPRRYLGQAGRVFSPAQGAVALVVVAALTGVAIYVRARGQPEPTDERAHIRAEGTALAIRRTGQPSQRESVKLLAPKIRPDFDESLAREALHAIQSGIRWLEQSQQDGGYWSDPSFPAMTGLAVSAILRSPQVLGGGERPRAASLGLAFILSCVRDDGGIYRHAEGVKGGGLPNYNTAICLAALADANDPEYEAAIRGARAFLVRMQQRSRDVFVGGMGYDANSGREYADVPNTYFALAALRHVKPLELGHTRSDLDWGAAIGFLSRCQHLRAFNDAAWVRETPEEKGGFVYNPVSTKVEAPNDEEGSMQAYGSATYAGVSGYLNAGLSPQAPRVEAALRWCARHWALDENPRLGQHSLYFYYLAMAGALNAAGREVLDSPEGRVRWRPALVEKLVSLQRRTEREGLGYWRNESNRWWENDPNLATSYALLALETAMLGREVPRQRIARQHEEP